MAEVSALGHPPAPGAEGSHDGLCLSLDARDRTNFEARDGADGSVIEPNDWKRLGGQPDRRKFWEEVRNEVHARSAKGRFALGARLVELRHGVGRTRSPSLASKQRVREPRGLRRRWWAGEHYCWLPQARALPRS